MSKIFLSYRRADTQEVSGRIYDQMQRAFGEQNVFKDVYSSEGEADFRKSISYAINQSQVVLVIIGPQWLNSADAAGMRRLDTPDDFVRLEIELALKRPGLLVIPVLVNEATMPSQAQLPASISQLAFRNARTVGRDPDFQYQVERIVTEIAQHIPRVDPGADAPGRLLPRPPEGVKPRRTPLPEKIYLVVFSIVFIAIASVIIWGIATHFTP